MTSGQTAVLGAAPRPSDGIFMVAPPESARLSVAASHSSRRLPRSGYPQALAASTARAACQSSHRRSHARGRGAARRPARRGRKTRERDAIVLEPRRLRDGTSRKIGAGPSNDRVAHGGIRAGPTGGVAGPRSARHRCAQHPGTSGCANWCMPCTTTTTSWAWVRRPHRNHRVVVHPRTSARYAAPPRHERRGVEGDPAGA
jgi:hypothetical protein